jgi:hypothetical protein
MACEDVMLGERSQMQKDKFYRILLTGVPRMVRFRYRKKNGSCQGLGEWMGVNV